jgi:hypothetical protein
MPVKPALAQTVTNTYDTEIEANYVQALKDMTEEIATITTRAIFAIGTFFDAEHQLDTQRDYQRLVAQTHKDYHPGEQMCQFGTFIRSVARSEEKTTLDKQALNRQLMVVYNNQDGAVTERGSEIDLISRIEDFKTAYCDPADNNGGLNLMCDSGGESDKERTNKDIDFARTVASNLTLDLDYEVDAATPDEKDIYTLARHLYWPEPFEPKDEKSVERYGSLYQAVRADIAKRNVAHNSFTNIVAEKSASKVGSGADSGWNFMKALMRDFGLNDTDTHKTMGNYPSYYAQMDVLTKKIYQNPDFYTNLYDKPVNLKRNSAAMEAIKLMQSRDLYKASLRREMLLSMMVEEQVAKRIDAIDTDLNR